MVEIRDRITLGYCIRVPGGWIYKFEEGESPVFVPFNNEFQKGFE